MRMLLLGDGVVHAESHGVSERLKGDRRRERCRLTSKHAVDLTKRVSHLVVSGIGRRLRYARAGSRNGFVTHGLGAENSLGRRAGSHCVGGKQSRNAQGGGGLSGDIRLLLSGGRVVRSVGKRLRRGLIKRAQRLGGRIGEHLNTILGNGVGDLIVDCGGKSHGGKAKRPGFGNDDLLRRGYRRAIGRNVS